ncbi:hypothetical protein [Bifidobacterium sp. SO4]|uniref:hypothetical protein n=1 Tax=Bifidobacterium sp. SO4 TaxID=2809030 RepID=UPI001BDCDEEE|nr:hypothetical protein [Bifidobacterium sp. SO4]MBT1171215.1 hypothetical protein [Bifidobacterium sp. SO4]
MTMNVILIAPDTESLPEGAKAAGLEYAVRRASDRAFLSDPDLDGTDSAWEDDAMNGTWVSSVDEAWDLADRFDLTDPDEEQDLLDGYQVVSRPWFYEDDLIDSTEPVALDKLDFSKLGITLDDFEK